MADAQKKTPEQKSKIKRLIVILLIVTFIFAGIVLYDQIYNTPMYDLSLIHISEPTRP